MVYNSTIVAHITKLSSRQQQTLAADHRHFRTRVLETSTGNIMIKHLQLQLGGKTFFQLIFKCEKNLLRICA